uniref:Uncharacterized protein n=1 Tax=Pithovirus LCDPAC02 TaxID=2506601 RepID=A0A481YPB6_9VIRU|nr:MAG: hypothetical protein LCDPAC02_01580 [Pithovirus LCDPAC02]
MEDIYIDCEIYITIQNYKFKIYDYSVFKYDNKSEIQFELWYISKNYKLRDCVFNMIYFNKEHNIETAIKLFNQTFENFNDTEESIEQFCSYFPKNINELVEFPECEDLLFEYMINTAIMHNIIQRNATCVIPCNKYFKFISKIKNLIDKFKETEEYKYYIENIKIDLVNRISNDLILHSIYSKKELLKELYKHITCGLNKNGFFTYCYSNSHTNKYLKEILDTINIDHTYICLPDNKCYKLDFDSCEIPSFKNFVFKNNNLEITLIDYLAF